MRGAVVKILVCMTGLRVGCYVQDSKCGEPVSLEERKVEEAHRGVTYCDGELDRLVQGIDVCHERLKSRRVMLPDHQDVVQKPKPQAWHWEPLPHSIIKEVVLKLGHEQIGKGRGTSRSHCNTADLAIDVSCEFEEIVCEYEGQ